MGKQGSTNESGTNIRHANPLTGNACTLPQRFQIVDLVGLGCGISRSRSQTTDAGNQPAKAKPRVGRNDPCPCGSGLKWKKCTCKEYHPDL